MDEKFQKILLQVKGLYQKYGIKSITMDDVARELSISKKTLYSYVKDKAELVSKVIETEINNHQCLIDGISLEKLNAIDVLLKASHFLEEQFKNMNPAVSYDLKKYYPESYEKIVVYRRKHVYDHILENMQQGIEQGLYRPEINIDIISYFYVLRIEETYLRPDETFLKEHSGDTIFNTLFDYHIRGIVNKKGLEYYENKINRLNK